MISKEEAEIIINKQINSDRLKTIIRNTAIVAWDSHITDEDVDVWLSNFDGRYFADVECERKLALWILAHYTLYTERDLRQLCSNLFGMILHKKLEESKESVAIKDVLKELLEDSLFYSFGNISESGQNILYYFRQESGLRKECFEPVKEKIYKNLFLIDDVSLSGSQADNYLDAVKSIKAEKRYACFLIATQNARTKISKAHREVSVIDVIELDKRDKAFSADSYVFSDARVYEIREHAEEFCKMYGEIAVKGTEGMSGCPLGFQDGQYMFGFLYNTPDNTLPIFWGKNNDWMPIFERHHKQSRKELILRERKFY